MPIENTGDESLWGGVLWSKSPIAFANQWGQPPKKTSFPRGDLYLKYEPLKFFPFECIYPYEPDAYKSFSLLESLYITKGMLIVYPLPEKTIFSGKKRIFPLCSAIAETPESRAYGLKFQPSSNNALLGTSSVGESGTA